MAQISADRPRFRARWLRLAAGTALGLTWLGLGHLARAGTTREWLSLPALAVGSGVAGALVALAVRRPLRRGALGWTAATVLALPAGVGLALAVAVVLSEPDRVLELERWGAAAALGVLGAGSALALGVVTLPLALATLWVLYRVDRALEPGLGAPAGEGASAREPHRSPSEERQVTAPSSGASIRQRMHRTASYLGAAAALGLPWFVAIRLLGGSFVRVNLAPWPAVLVGAVVTTVVVAAAVRPLLRLGRDARAFAVLAAPLLGGALLPGLALVAESPSLLLQPLELGRSALVLGLFGGASVVAWALVVYPLALGTVWVLYRVDEALEDRRLPPGVSARPTRP